MAEGRIPLPLPFILIVSAVVFLVIFFGAWAVSVDAADQNKSLSSEFAGGAGPEATAAASAAASGEDGGGAWWEDTLLKACPFH